MDFIIFNVRLNKRSSNCVVLETFILNENLYTITRISIVSKNSFFNLRYTVNSNIKAQLFFSFQSVQVGESFQVSFLNPYFGHCTKNSSTKIEINYYTNKKQQCKQMEIIKYNTMSNQFYCGELVDSKFKTK